MKYCTASTIFSIENDLAQPRCVARSSLLLLRILSYKKIPTNYTARGLQNVNKTKTGKQCIK